MDKLDIAAPGGSHYSGMGNFSAAFASGKKNDIALLQIMNRDLLTHLALLRGGSGQVDASTLEGKEDQRRAVNSRTRRSSIAIRRPSKGFSRVHYLIDPLVLYLSGR